MGTTTKKEKIQKLLRFLIVFSIIAVFFTAIYLILKWTGLLDKIDDLESLKNIIKEGGVFSALIFFCFQFLQVTFIPVPSFLTTLAGSLIFGPYIASLISIVAIFIGSLLAFHMGKKYGKKLVTWILGEKDAEKWENILTKGQYAFFLMLLFPAFPDDALCLVAGLTKMSYKFFITSVLIARPIAIICTCFLGSGYLIPFTGIGILIWIIIILVLATLFTLSFVYQNKINDFLINFNGKIKRKKNAK